MNQDGVATLYWCDPEKNTECAKRICKYVLTKEEGGVCEATFQPAFARTDENGKPMVYEKWEHFQRAKNTRKRRK